VGNDLIFVYAQPRQDIYYRTCWLNDIKEKKQASVRCWPEL